MILIFSHKTGADVFILDADGNVLLHSFQHPTTVRDLIVSSDEVEISEKDYADVIAKVYDKNYTVYQYSEGAARPAAKKSAKAKK